MSLVNATTRTRPASRASRPVTSARTYEQSRQSAPMSRSGRRRASRAQYSRSCSAPRSTARYSASGPVGPAGKPGTAVDSNSVGITTPPMSSSTVPTGERVRRSARRRPERAVRRAAPPRASAPGDALPEPAEVPLGAASCLSTSRHRRAGPIVAVRRVTREHRVGSLVGCDECTLVLVRDREDHHDGGSSVRPRPALVRGAAPSQVRLTTGPGR